MNNLACRVRWQKIDERTNVIVEDKDIIDIGSESGGVGGLHLRTWRVIRSTRYYNQQARFSSIACRF